MPISPSPKQIGLSPFRSCLPSLSYSDLVASEGGEVGAGLENSGGAGEEQRRGRTAAQRHGDVSSEAWTALSSSSQRASP